MTAAQQYQPGYPSAPAPQQPQPPYPSAPPPQGQPQQQPGQYPAQPAYQPQYPGQPAYQPPPASYPQPQQPQQQYGWPQPAQQPQSPPPQPLAQGSIDDFYSQPSTGGAFLKFNAPGDTYFGIVTHTPTKADVRQSTTPPNQGSVPQFYRDGRPKLEMLVSLRMQPTHENPEGIGIFAVKGADRDELARAMSEAGAPEGPPQGGSGMQITFTESRPTRGGIPRKVKQIRYVTAEQLAAGGGGEQTAAPAAAAVPPQQMAPVVPLVPPAAQQFAQGFPGAQFAPPAQPAQPQQAQPQQIQQPQAGQAAAPGMTLEQQALLASLGA